MHTRYTKRGAIVETQDVNTADPEIAKGTAIVTLGRLRGEGKADGWEIVNEIGKRIMTSEN